MDKAFKFLDVEVKKATEAENAFWFAASTADRDRDGDIIVPKGWKLQNYKKNPVVLYGHNYHALPVGKSIDVKIEDNKLRSLIQFASGIDEFAGRVERMVDAGYLKTVSVGFIPYKVEDLTEEDKKQRPEWTWGKRLHAELLEISIVPVPANPAALREREFCDLVAKGFGVTSAVAEEKESPLLPYKKDGKADPRMLKACIAALAGARGGVPIPEAEKAAHMRHLVGLMHEIDPLFSLPTHITQENLKAAFEDVWHEELLDVIQLGLEEKDREVLTLIKGPTREAFAAAHAALGKILQATEEAPAPAPTKAVDENGAALITGIISDLSAVTSRLK